MAALGEEWRLVALPTGAAVTGEGDPVELSLLFGWWSEWGSECDEDSAAEGGEDDGLPATSRSPMAAATPLEASRLTISGSESNR